MDKIRKIDLITYACGHGAKIKSCADAAVFLRKSNLDKSIKNSTWLEVFYSDESNKEARELVADYCNDLCKKTENSVAKGNFPLIFGGDHSMAMGSWSGVASALDGNLGLIWFDAHMDSHTPETSHSGAYHGMPLATLLGQGDDRLCSIGKNPALKAQNICLIGIRSYEKEEKQLLDSLGVRVFYMDEIEQKGLEFVTGRALEIVSKNTQGFGVTVDIDVIDPVDAPGTGSKEHGGIKLDNMVKSLEMMKNNDHLMAIEIAEFNPNLDQNNKTYDLIISLLKAVL